jgi:hypothetical protein
MLIQSTLTKMGANVHTDPKQQEKDVGEFATIELAHKWVCDSGAKDCIYTVWVSNPLEDVDRSFVERWSWRNNVRRNDGISEYF